MPLGFAKAHHKITPIRKGGCVRELGKLPKLLGFSYNISATAEDINFEIDTLLEFAKAHHKIPHIKNVRGPEVKELPELLGFPFNICVTAEASNFKFGVQLEFVKAHHKTTPRGKSIGVALCYLGFSFNISATAALST